MSDLAARIERSTDGIRYDDRCGPCKVISRVFEKLSDEFETLIFGKVDVDTQEVRQLFRYTATMR